MWLHLFLARSAAASVSLHLLPAPAALSNTQIAPASVSWADITSVLAHVNGVSRLLRTVEDAAFHGQTEQSVLNVLSDENVLAIKSDVFKQPDASLVILLGGLETDKVPVSPSFVEDGASSSITHVSNYLNHFAELLASDRKSSRANIFTFSSVCGDSVNSIPGVSRMVLRKEAAVVSSPDSATSALKSTMNSIASTVYSSPSATFSSTFREIADVTVLKEAVEVDRLFMVEMNAASAFLDALESQSAPMLNSRNIGFSPDYFSVSLTRLNNIWEMYGADSKEFTVASAILTTIVTKLLNVFEATYPNLSVQILTVIPLSRVTNRRDGLPPGLDRRLASVNVHCPQFFKDCMTLSNNCSNHGMCALAPNPRASNQSCFFCSCYTNNTDDNGELIIGGSNRKVLWAGPACAQQDISSEFHLLFWTTVGIAIVVVFVVGLLASVGSEDSNTAGAGSGKSKDD